MLRGVVFWLRMEEIAGVCSKSRLNLNYFGRGMGNEWVFFNADGAFRDSSSGFLKGEEVGDEDSSLSATIVIGLLILNVKAFISIYV